MYKLLFIIIALFVIMFSVSQCNEGFTNTTSTPTTLVRFAALVDYYWLSMIDIPTTIGSAC